MRRCISLLLVLSALSFSEIATQTDWSGSSGVIGPVTDWGSDYYSSSNINGFGGTLTLATEILDQAVEHIVDNSFAIAYSVYATDVDGDGDTDVLGASAGDNTIAWWENTDGAGTTWTEHTVESNFASAQSVYAADVDGDGNTDVLGAASVCNTIAWWEVIGYPGTGLLESSILDTGTVGSWELFVSASQRPAGTSIGFQFRSSEDFGTMGDWSDTVFTTGTALTGILADSTKYLQYKVILNTADSVRTPTLEDVNFSYTVPVGIGESSAGETGLHPSRNPCYGDLSIQIGLAEPGFVELQVFDIIGRLVAEVSQEFLQGTHVLNISGLPDGNYICVMKTGGYTGTERIVLLK